VKAYLLKEQSFVAGEETFIECVSSENNYSVIFVDDTDTGYFFAGERDSNTGELRILDGLHIYNIEEVDEKDRPGKINILWSTDWLKCALVINNYCHAVFDFEQQGGYNRNEFPPPNNIWTKGERTLTDEMIAEIFV